VSDHADTIREALREASEWFDTEGVQVRASDCHRAVAALDSLVAERDEARRLYDAALRDHVTLIHQCEAAEAERENLLPADEVCACLSETGGRQVRIYERCERCRALMESDYPERLEAAEARVTELEAATQGVLDCTEHHDGCPKCASILRAALGEDA